MRKSFSDEDLKRVLGAELGKSDVIDAKIEEAYDMIRNAERKTDRNTDKNADGKTDKRHKRRKNPWKGIGIGFSCVAATLVLTAAFCVMNPVMAKEIPVLGSLFAKVADVFSFGKLPEEDTTELYTVEGEDLAGTAGEDGLHQGNGNGGAEELYQKTDRGVTVTLTEEYASNQAVYVGIRVENEQEFPEMAVYEGGAQQLHFKTQERYSFRKQGDASIDAQRTLEGKFEDAHTFVGIMRIDYSEIDKDESKYEAALREAEARGEELWLTDENYFDYIEQYEIPEAFTMELEISDIIGDLAEPIVPEGTKSKEELEKMSDEEWEAYMQTLPEEWYQFPNKYENWDQEGSWKFELTIARKDEKARTILVNETNADGIGLGSLEISSVEMTLHIVEPAGTMTFAVALDANGNKIENGSSNADELSIAGHDISKVYVYICDYDEYMDEIKGYGVPGNHSDRSFQEVLEERALFKTVVYTE